MTLLATIPDPRAPKPTPNSSRAQPSSSVATQSLGTENERGHPAKRQKTMVDPADLPECEARLTRATAPPLFLDPVDSLEAAQDLLKFMESPLHRDPPPSPKRRKRTVAELAADEAMAAEEERFMLIMDERLEPTTSATAGGSKSAVDDAAGAMPFEPRFSRFKTLENIRIQHDEKAKREHEMKVKQDMAKRQQQEQERERRRLLEQRQAEEHAKEEARRQQLAAQQAQAQLAAQQHNRQVMAQANGVSHGPQTSPVVRNQTPHNVSSPMAGNAMQGGVPMSMTSSGQGAGSPPRPPSALQHAHPNMMSHPMAASRSQQGPSRHGTPQMNQGTPAMTQATPIMRNVTPSQRMNHGSPNHTMAQTPGMNQAVMGTPHMGGPMGLTPQQQQQILMHQRQQQILAQQGQGQLGPQFTAQQIARMQANAHAQQNIQSHQGMQQGQQNPQAQQAKMQNPQAYQAHLMRAQLAQMQAQQQHQQQQHPQNPQMHGQQGQSHQGSPQMTQQQQQQMMMAAAQANGRQMPKLNGMNITPQQFQMYQSRLMHLRQEFAQRNMNQYGPPTQYPPQIAQHYHGGLERSAKTWLMQSILQGDAQQRASQAVQAQNLQQHQQNMMH